MAGVETQLSTSHVRAPWSTGSCRQRPRTDLETAIWFHYSFLKPGYPQFLGPIHLFINSFILYVKTCQTLN